MSRWFRVYDDMVNDPKIQKLIPERFKLLVNIWCVASKNDGKLPSLDDLAFMLRMRADDLAQELEYFIGNKLIDKKDGRLIPHNWNTRQYKSDTSAERVKKHRQKQQKQAA